MSLIKRPEVLVPAGDFERLEAGIKYGADAIYLGGSLFTMRASPQNFSFEQLKEATTLAHKNNVRIYLTCNTLPTNEEMDLFPEFIKEAEKSGIDAFIATDIGVLSMIKKYAPNSEIHISTQAGIVNYVTANEFYNMGAKRIVLARELSLDQIKIIRDKTPSDLEIEAFVHGAMCVSFSGRCLLSSYLVNRDANRGECAQPCRWGYHLVEEKRPDQPFPIYEDEKGTYILNAKDMCMIEHIDKLVDAGISSLKIEGRAKSAYYVAVIANAYRMAVDHYLKNPNNFKLPQWIVDETTKVSHRQYSTGFYFGAPENGQYYENGGYIRSFDVIAIVDEYKDDFLYITQRNKFIQGDEIEILQPKQPPFSYIIDKIYDLYNNEMETAPHPMMKLKIPFDKKIEAGSILRKKI